MAAALYLKTESGDDYLYVRDGKVADQDLIDLAKDCLGDEFNYVSEFKYESTFKRKRPFEINLPFNND